MKWISVFVLPVLVGTGVVFVSSDWKPDSRIEERRAGDLTPESEPSQAATRQIFAGGFVEGSGREVPLDFEVVGRLTDVAVEEGSRVKKGELLAQIDDTLWRHTLAEAEAQLAHAEAEHQRLVNGERTETRAVARAEAELAHVRVQHTETEYRRAMVLSDGNAITAESLDKARFAFQAASAEYAAAQARVAEIEAAARPDEVRIASAKILLAQAAVDRAEEMLSKARLLAPFDGIVLRTTSEPGELISSQRDEPLIIMSNTEQFHVRAYVEELDALNLKLGQSAYVTADGRPDERYTGRLVWLAPVMGPKRMRHNKAGERMDVKVREVLVRLDRADSLVIGVPVDVFIEMVLPISGGNTPQPESPDASRDLEALANAA